jgi:hypothetical protein
MSIGVKAHLVEAEVALDAVGCEEHFSLTSEYKQEAVQGLKHKRSLVIHATTGPHF